MCYEFVLIIESLLNATLSHVHGKPGEESCRRRFSEQVQVALCSPCKKACHAFVHGKSGHLLVGGKSRILVRNNILLCYCFFMTIKDSVIETWTNVSTRFRGRLVVLQS